MAQLQPEINQEGTDSAITRSNGFPPRNPGAGFARASERPMTIAGFRLVSGPPFLPLPEWNVRPPKATQDENKRPA